MIILINMLSPDCGAFLLLPFFPFFVSPAVLDLFPYLNRCRVPNPDPLFPILKMLGLQYSKPVDRDKMTGRCRLTGSYRITGRCSLTDRVRVTGRRRLPDIDRMTGRFFRLTDRDCPTDRYGLTD
jgi:hypothetical protein